MVGKKGDCSKFNRGLDCDVIVAEVRATSHKPDEIYGIIERLAPGTRYAWRLHNHSVGDKHVKKGEGQVACSDLKNYVKIISATLITSLSPDAYPFE